MSRPSLREALRILEAEGLITVVRGALGGVVVHEPNERMTARTAALVLQARNVPLADVYDARSMLEPDGRRHGRPIVPPAVGGQGAAAPRSTSRRRRRRPRRVRRSPTPGSTSGSSALAGNQTLTIVAEMLNEIVSRAVTAVAQTEPAEQSTDVRRRGIRSQRRLVELIVEGDATAAEEHWRAHMAVVGKVLLGQKATMVVDLLDHY